MKPLTTADILAAHREHGPLDWHMVKRAMGANWPDYWERMGPGEGIFAPDEQRLDHPSGYLNGRNHTTP